MFRLILFLSIALFCFILWIIYLANTGESSVFFDLVKALPYGDKMGHLLIFGFLTLGANLSFKFQQLSVGIISVYWGTFLVIVFSLIEELSQHFIPTRTLDTLDILADVVGISVFTAISALLNKNGITKRLVKS